MDGKRQHLTFTRDVDQSENDGIYSRAFQAILKQCAKEWGVGKNDVRISSWSDYEDHGIQLWASRLETEAETAARLKAEDDKRKEFEARAKERAANVALAFEQSAAKMSEPKQGGLCIAPLRLMRGTETILAKIALPRTSIINIASVDSDCVHRMLLAAFPGFEDWWVSRLGEDEWGLVPDPHNEDHIVLVRPDDVKRGAS